MCADTEVKKNTAHSAPQQRKNLRMEQSLEREDTATHRYDYEIKIERSGAIVSDAAKRKKMIRNCSYKISAKA